MTTLDDLKTRFMEKPAFRKEYARADEEYALIEAMLRARTAAKLTRAELAERLGMTRSAVARLENGQVSPSLKTLRRYAEATGTKLTVNFTPVTETVGWTEAPRPEYGEDPDRDEPAEALARGNLMRLLRDTGLEVESLRLNVAVRSPDGLWQEYDLVADGEDEVVVLEARMTLYPTDVSHFVSRLGDFRKWRPECYARPRLYGAISYLTAKDDAIRMAEKAGFYLIQAAGYNASIVNSEGFKPRLF